MNRAGILAAGNWIVDKLKVIDTWPQQDALANILSETTGNGGSPFNILIDLARLGAGYPLSAVGLVGDDSDGEWIRGQCAEHGIDTAQLHSHPRAHTSYTDVMTVQSTGRRTFFHQRGANAFLDAGHFDFSASNARIFHLGYLLLLDRLDTADPDFGTVAARVLQMARAAGCYTSVDLVSEDSHRFSQIVRPALPYTDYFIVNEFEAERTTGIRTRQSDVIDFAALEEVSRTLLNEGVREWVVIHFPEGACAMGRDGVLHSQGSVCVPQEEIVSAVGAGDAFAAGVLHGLHNDEPIQAALRYGICSAAACLRGSGTSTGIRPLADCLAYAEKCGSRAPLNAASK